MFTHRSLTPATLAALYGATACLWIIVTDSIVGRHATEAGNVTFIHTTKGLLFVVLSATGLYLLLRRHHAAMEAKSRGAILASERSERARRMFATLGAANRHIVHARDRQTLADEICQALVDSGAFEFASIGRVDANARTLEVCAGATRAAIPRPPPGTRMSIPPGDLLLTSALQDDPLVFHPGENDGPFCQLCRTHGFQSAALIPFRGSAGDRLLLVVCAREAGFFTADDIAIATQLSTDLECGYQVIAEREARAAAELELRASEERHRVIAESVQDVIWIVDLKGRLVYLSPAVKELLQRTPEELTGLPISHLLTPESLRLAQEHIQGALAELRETGRVTAHLLTLDQVRADGTIVPTEITATGYYDRRGVCTGFLGVTRNLHKRREAEQAIAREADRVSALLNLSVDGIHVVDLDGRLLDANDIFLRTRGFTRAEAKELHVAAWSVDASFEELRRRTGETDQHVMLETLHRRRDGTTFPVEVCARRVKLDGRALIYCSARDIADRKVMEQRFLRAQRLESVGLIASGIAHDLNNVLTPILLSTGILRIRYSGAEDRPFLDSIDASAKRGSAIVQQILTFARGAEGQRVTLEPAVLLKELVVLMKETFPRNITHRLEIDRDVRAITGDPTQLHQVLLNLAVNARDAMPTGGTLHLRVRNHRFTEASAHETPGARAGDYVCISVSDTGCGMSGDVLDHIFEPFFSTKPRGKGTGLGLSTVHGLVRSHGGFVEVSSRVGLGSEFRVFLPAAAAQQPAAAVVTPKGRPRLGNGETVLVVDDEDAIVIVARMILAREGFDVIVARDGQEALQVLEQTTQPVALVITDVMMPRCDGVTLIHELRRRHPFLPVIAMSGLVDAENENEGMARLKAAGVNSILEKPYAEADLLDAVEAALPLTAAEAV